MPLGELINALERITQTLKANGLLGVRPHMFAEREAPSQTHTFDALIEAFGWTIGKLREFIDEMAVDFRRHMRNMTLEICTRLCGSSKFLLMMKLANILPLRRHRDSP